MNLIHINLYHLHTRLLIHKNVLLFIWMLIMIKLIIWRAEVVWSTLIRFKFLTLRLIYFHPTLAGVILNIIDKTLLIVVLNVVRLILAHFETLSMWWVIVRLNRTSAVATTVILYVGIRAVFVGLILLRNQRMMIQT